MEHTLCTWNNHLLCDGLQEFQLFQPQTGDDDALGSVVMSWPHLECLYLGNRYFWKTRPSITFRGLMALLSSCPILETLGLALDATKGDLPEAEKPGGEVCNTKITSFGVGFSPIEQLAVMFRQSYRA